jgi:hypothetical protein
LNPGTSQYEDKCAFDVTTAVCVRMTLVRKKVFSFLGKLRAIYKNLTLLSPNMATKLLRHPPLLRENVLKTKTTFLIKKD